MNAFKDFSINKKKNSLFKILVAGIIFLILLCIINFFVSPIKNIFYQISSPIQKNFWIAGESSSSFISSFVNAQSIAQENKNLQNQNQKLLSQVSFLQSIEQANQAQSNISLSCQNTGFNLLMVGVTGLDENDILSINKGSDDGITEGMPVIGQQNVLFGKVIKVYKNFSKVMLISNKSSVINVKIQQSVQAEQNPINTTNQDNPDNQNDQNKDNQLAQVILNPEVDGVVKGKGGLNAYLDLIPVDSNINSQDVLVTSSLDKSFPKDLLVAKITQKEKNDQKPFQQAQINLFFDIKSTDNLFVITNYKQDK